MPLVAIFVVNLIVFILCVIGVLSAFFSRRWKLFIVILIGVILSAGGVAVELAQWLLPPPSSEKMLFLRNPSPL